MLGISYKNWEEEVSYTTHSKDGEFLFHSRTNKTLKIPRLIYLISNFIAEIYFYKKKFFDPVLKIIK
jgi:hypothetical protein